MYVTPNDVDEYARAIVALTDDEPKRALLGKLGAPALSKNWPGASRRRLT